MLTASLFELQEMHSVDPLIMLQFVSITMSLKMDWINTGILNYNESSLQRRTGR